MGELHKNLVTDDHNRPVAVQIDYAEWVALEEHLADLASSGPHVADIDRHAGTLTLREDPLEYQTEVRREWR